MYFFPREDRQICCNKFMNTEPVAALAALGLEVI